MKAVLLRGPKDVVIDEIPVPEISDDDVLVEVKYAGICGSDLHAYRAAIHYPPGTYLGHEYSGVLVKVGKNVRGWRVGDRITGNPLYICGECYACKRGRPQQCEHVLDAPTGGRPVSPGAFARFMRLPIPERRLCKLPDDVSFEEGALVEPLASGLHAVRISDLKAGEDTIVLGAGPIGLGVIAFLKYAGAGLIIATEIVERRAAMAKKFGADYVFNPLKEPNLKEKVLELTNGKGIDRVYTCAGTVESFRTATDFIRHGGQIMVVDCVEEEVPIIPTLYCYCEWEMKGALCYDYDEFPMTIEYLRKGLAPVKEMITKKIKLSDIVKEGFEVLINPGHNEIKILVEPED